MMFRNFKKNVDGNVAMMFGVLITLLMLSVGVAIDGARLYSLKSSVQNIADTAALAGAHAADIEQERRRGAVRRTIDSHIAQLGNGVELVNFEIAFHNRSETLTVGVTARQELLFGAFLGKDFGRVTGETRTSYAIENLRPVSISMVLDVSGSMNEMTSLGASRLDVVKTASADLFTAIEQGSPRPELIRDQVRTNLNVYNNQLLPEFTVPPTEGWNDVLDQIRALQAGGGTSSTDAFEAGVNALLFDPAKPNDVQEFVVFMTDGNNNQAESDTQTLALCDQAKADGIRVFTVAFEAPQNGQDLLEACATIPAEDHYFDASDAAQFRAAFDEIGATIANLNTRITD